MKNKLLNMIILLGFCSVSVLGVITYQSLKNINFIKTEYQNILNNGSERVNLSKDIEINLLKMHRGENNFINENDSIIKDIHKRNFYLYKKSLDEYLIKLKNLIKIQEQEIKDFESAYDRYIYSFDELTKLKSQQDISKLAILHREILDKAMDELSKIIFFNIEDMNKTVLNLNENYNDLVSYLKFILFILSLVVFSFVLYIYKFMALRFKKIDKAISIIKNKEFTNSFEIITVLEKDELSQIETSLYDAILLLRENDIVQKQQNWIKNSIIESTLIIYEKESINQILDSAISNYL